MKDFCAPEKRLQNFRRSFRSSKHAISSFFLFRGEKLVFILPDTTPHLVGYGTYPMSDDPINPNPLHCSQLVPYATAHSLEMKEIYIRPTNSVDKSRQYSDAHRTAPGGHRGDAAPLVAPVHRHVQHLQGIGHYNIFNDQ